MSRMVILLANPIDNTKLASDKKQSRNMNGTKSKEEIKGKASDYYIKDKLASKVVREYVLSSTDQLTFDETKATSRLKDTLEKIAVERDHFKDDRDKLLLLLDEKDDWNFKLAAQEIEIGEQIGWGAYSAVFKCKFYGIDVAVKKFSKTDEKSLKVYANEVKLLKTCHHPGIAQLIGYYEDADSYWIVSEYFPWGTLYELIHTKTIQLPIKKKLTIAIEIAQVMNYLHSRKRVILHRDLKSENVLIDKSLRIKLWDFGISKIIEDEDTDDIESPLSINKQTKTMGTVSWMSPEFINDKVSSK